jgi:hypothetical protein
MGLSFARGAASRAEEKFTKTQNSKPKTNSGGATLPSFSKQALVRARAGV